MYGNEYENYIRSILGYPNINSDLYQSNNRSDYTEANKKDLEELYPEVYKIVYPKVRTAINKHITANTKEDIENITTEIYVALGEESHADKDKQEINSKHNLQKANKIEETENRGGNNNNMKDLIKILLIRELLKNPPPPPPRSPYDRPPMKPPMHRGYQYQPLYDIYEY